MWDFNSASPLSRLSPGRRPHVVGEAKGAVWGSGRGVGSGVVCREAGGGAQPGTTRSPAESDGPGGGGRDTGNSGQLQRGEAGRAGREGGAANARVRARREHGARNWRARLAGGTVSSRRTRPGPGGCGAVAAAGAQADPRADPRKELKEVGAPVAAGVGAVKEDGHGDSSVVRVVGAGHRRELLHVWLLSARACGPLACLTMVGGGGDRDCSTTRVAFLALPTQLLHARRRRRHLEPATPRLASLRVGGSDRDCSAPERSRVYEEPNDVTVCDLAVVEQI
eukprot:XP_016879406.1 uncharacterized protein LOC105371191 [Homo sapiens]